ncbi:hypothetical protein BGZ73_008043 [Actinomortierella ambigua]|nr:hypothetical protein BGZ73_008043 [Actinomortierella ambigua]
MSVSSSAGPIGSLNQGGASGISTGASGGMAGLAALPPSSSLGIVENCSMTHIDLDPSGTIAVASGSDKSIRVYDLMQKLCLARMVCHSELITGVKLSSDFKHIYSTSGDGCILVWRLSSALIKKIDSRQQMMQDKLTLAKSQEQARRMAQQEDDDGDGPMDEREAHHEQRRKNNRWRSLSQSAAVAQSASRRPSTSHNVLPPPLPPPRTLSPSPSAGKTLRHSPSMDRQLHPYIYKDSLSASDLSNASRRNSEASILSDDANDSVSAEEVSSSDGLSYPDRPRQQGQLAARPSTPNRHRMKSGHRPGAPMSSKSDATEANESAFQVSIASPESLLIHKRLSRTLGSNSESTTPTGDRSRTNSISNSLPSSLTSMSMNFQAHSATTAGAASTSTSFTPKTVQRSTTPTPVSQASSGLPSSTSTSSLANRPAWGRAPLPAPKGVTPTKSSVVTTTAPASSARRRQRTTSVISGRISFLAANNNNNTLSNAFNNHSQDLADQDNNTTSTLPTGAKTLPGQGGESDEMEDPLSDSATGSDMEDPELVRATQIAQFSVSTEAAEFDHHGSEQDHGPSFAEGEDMAVHRSGTASPRLYRSSLQQQQQRQSQRVRASMGVSAAGHTGGDASATSVAIKPGRQSLTLRFLSASRSKLLDALQPTGSGSNAVEGEGEGVRAHGDKSHVEPPPMLGMSQPSTLEIEAMEGRLNPTSPSSSSQDGMSAKRAKLQQPPPIARGDAGQRSSSSALSASESFLSLGVEEVEHPRTEGDLHHRQHHAGHVLASPAFVQSPVAGLNMMKDHGDGGGGIVHRLQQTLEDAVGSLPVRDHHAMEVDEEEDNVKKDEKTVLHDDDRSPLNRAKAIANVMDQLQMLLGDSCPLGSPPLLLQPSSDLPERRPSLPQLDRATLEGTKDRLLQMVGSIQGQLWLMQAEESQPVLHPKPQAGR